MTRTTLSLKRSEFWPESALHASRGGSFKRELRFYVFPYILVRRKNDSKCLVHCKMGVSRSASTVIAYAMKEFGWTLDKAYNFVKQKRSVTRPNPGFMRQLAEYEGILDAR